jgi:hypothetical protein
MLRQSDLFGRAERCERAMTAASDPQKIVAFRILRDMWITLANESVSLTGGELARQVSAIEELQFTVMGNAAAE